MGRGGRTINGLSHRCKRAIFTEHRGVKIVFGKGTDPVAREGKSGVRLYLFFGYSTSDVGDVAVGAGMENVQVRVSMDEE